MSQSNLRPLFYETVTYKIPAAATATDTNIFIAPYDCYLVDAYEVHSVAGSDGSAVNLQLTKDTGTTAPGAGTDLLANNSDAGFNLKGTADTVQAAVFKTTAGIRNLAKGDRISVDFAGTQTSVAGTTVTLVIARNAD